jgi:hypothetical protein
MKHAVLVQITPPPLSPQGKEETNPQAMYN